MASKIISKRAAVDVTVDSRKYLSEWKEYSYILIRTSSGEQTVTNDLGRPVMVICSGYTRVDGDTYTFPEELQRNTIKKISDGESFTIYERPKALVVCV